MSDQLFSLCDKTKLREEFIPEDLKWVDEIEPLNEFFTWLSDCVFDRNCITPEELKTYEILLEAGKFEDVEEPLNESQCANAKPSQVLSDLPKCINVRDLQVLENVYQQKQTRLANLKDYFKLIKTYEGTTGNYKVHSKIDELLESELSKISCLISGEYRQSTNALATKCSQLNDNLRNVSEGTNFADLICLSSFEEFCHLAELLNSFTSTSMKIAQEKAEKCGYESFNKKSQDDDDDLCSPRFMDDETQRIFDDCVHLKAAYVRRQSQMKGISEILQALNLAKDQWGEFVTISKSAEVNPVNPDDLNLVCYDLVKADFLKYELKFSQDKRTEMEKILAILQGFRNCMRPLKLCCDSIYLLIINEYRWIRVAGAILSDCLGGIRDIHNEIEQSYRKIKNMRTVQELSYTTNTAPDISSTFLKVFDSRCDFSTVSHNDTLPPNGYSLMKSFSVDIINLLSCAKSVYYYLFNGPSATMPVDWDKISTIIQSSQTLKTQNDEMEKLNCKQIALKIHFHEDDLHNLINKFWFLYSQNPLQLRQQVEAMEARALLSRNNHLASKDCDGDALEKYFL